MKEIDFGQEGQFPANSPFCYSADFEVWNKHLELPSGQKIVEKALQFEGFPSIGYKSSDKGLTPKEGFDCSGFVRYVLSDLGIYLPEGLRHANQMFDRFGTFVHFGQHQQGDLVFLSRDGAYPSHVGIVVSDSEYIHAPGLDGTRVKVDPLRMEEIGTLSTRAVYNQNPIGIKRIAIEIGRWNIVANNES